MVNDNNSKVKMILSVLAIIASIVYILVTFGMRKELGWCAFIDCFALFMASFLWMMSIAIGKIIPLSGIAIRNFAIGAFALFLVSLVIELIVFCN